MKSINFPNVHFIFQKFFPLKSRARLRVARRAPLAAPRAHTTHSALARALWARAHTHFSRSRALSFSLSLSLSLSHTHTFSLSLRSLFSLSLSLSLSHTTFLSPLSLTHTHSHTHSQNGHIWKKSSSLLHWNIIVRSLNISFVKQLTKH